jgi:hypothetical protein
MADKRSLGEALALTPKELAFIQGSDEKAGNGSTRPVRKETRTIDLPLSEAADMETELEPSRPRERQKRQRAAETAFSIGGDALDKMLVPLTTRLPHGLVQSLRRMCLEQRLQHAKPDSIQEVVQTALEHWLLKQSR